MRKVTHQQLWSKKLKTGSKTKIKYQYLYNMKNCVVYFTGVLLFAVLLTACESNNHFRSKKKIKEQIQGKWELVYPELNETWSFENGTLYVDKLVGTSIAKDTGTYSIETTWKEPYVNVSGIELFTTPWLDLNGKWTIIELDNKILYIAIRPDGTGLHQREFIKD